MKKLSKKKVGFIVLTLILLIIILMAQTPNIDENFRDPDKIIGTWRSTAKDSQMEIYKSRKTYKGRLIEGWGLELYEKDGKTFKKDSKNPDANLQNRTLANMEFISEMTFENGAYIGGKLYMAQIGKSVNCRIYFKKDELIMRIYLGFPILGITKKWSRVE
ncbi:uncharacterized protein (DUF2147 family) [Tenacibaculum adriaticum]|uniref:Uncharacterized protein (DUF2147 family) n=1 Tax=Tenacibaculum adriaticum TaxID=413713 RepID=A0A5S5DR49_9FLAO|nr:DUF2147 domain-containing protein [Tenacibaculum adriaticum]TYP97486.1 uncharacterized protein (DUF2147 family) [Tenacibaculum adriaticum]